MRAVYIGPGMLGVKAVCWGENVGNIEQAVRERPPLSDRNTDTDTGELHTGTSV